MNKILIAIMALAFVAGVSLTIAGLGSDVFSNSDSHPAAGRTFTNGTTTKLLLIQK